MSEIQPFFGWRYDPGKVDLPSVLAPPYDVVTPEERRSYLSRSPYNVFHLELGDDGPGEDRYRRARKLWDAWRREGVLVREEAPSLYLYRLRFSWRGRSLVRRGLIALVSLFPWEERRVLPHEKTFDRVTEDRLRLLRATRAQFSQIFCLYHDPGLRSVEALEAAASPLFSVEDAHGFSHQLCRVAAPEAVAAVRRVVEAERLYIADGHHRYTTALRFMREMEAEFGKEPRRCFHYMMMYLCPFEEPGLLVLPTHRLLRLDLGGEELLRLWASWGEFAELDPGAVEAQVQRLEPHQLLVLHGPGVWLFSLREEALSRLGGGLPGQTSRLPVSLFTGLLRETLGVSEAELREEGRLTYTPWVQDLIAGARDGAFGFALPETPLSALEEVARAGLVMPHKSTYFFPKILTGTVFFEMAPERRPPC